MGWHSLLCGSQLWLLGPPDAELPAGDIRGPASWLMSGGGGAAATHLVKLEGGDTLFVPSGWWFSHVCLPGEVSISLSKAALLSASMPYAAPLLQRGRPRLLQSLLSTDARRALQEVLLLQERPQQTGRIEGSGGFGVERVHFSQLSVAEFRRRWELAAEPLIIQGLAPFLASSESLGFSLEFLRDVLQSDLEVPVRVCGRTVPKMELGDFFKLLDKGEDVYLADVSIAGYFPWLFEHVRVPRYFLHCFSHRTRRRNWIMDKTPSLFVGAKGSRSTLHIDQLASNFYMFLAEGAKHWTCFHRDDAEQLSYDWDEEEQIRRFKPFAEAEPPGTVRRVAFTLEEGEVLFIPNGTPHEVVNETRTVSVSSNFFDQTNLALAMEQLRAKLSKLDPSGPRHANLLNVLESLDEIEWPDLEEDVQARDEQPRPGEEMGGLHECQEALKSARPLNFRTY